MIIVVITMLWLSSSDGSVLSLLKGLILPWESLTLFVISCIKFRCLLVYESDVIQFPAVPLRTMLTCRVENFGDWGIDSFWSLNFSLVLSDFLISELRDPSQFSIGRTGADPDGPEWGGGKGGGIPYLGSYLHISTAGKGGCRAPSFWDLDNRLLI